MMAIRVASVSQSATADAVPPSAVRSKLLKMEMVISPPIPMIGPSCSGRPAGVAVGERQRARPIAAFEHHHSEQQTRQREPRPTGNRTAPLAGTAQRRDDQDHYDGAIDAVDVLVLPEPGQMEQPVGAEIAGIRST